MMVLESNSLIDFNGAVRKVLSLVLALVMTTLLFYVMYSLIKNDSVPPIADPTPHIPNVRYEAPPKIHEPIPELPVRPTKIETPESNIVEQVETGKGPSIRIIDPILINPTLPTVNLAIAAQSLPMVKFAPVYPQSAAANGIEGFVDVVFDVTETGATENIQIVYAEPARTFNSAVLKAVSRWKYKPKMENDVAMKMFGLRERIRFNLEK